jgi:hypothetical protein
VELQDPSEIINPENDLQEYLSVALFVGFIFNGCRMN